MTPELPSTAQSCLSHIRSIRTTLQLPCVYFPHAPQISGLLPRFSITFLLPAPPRSPQPFLPVPPTLGLQFLENAHLGSPADSPISSCPHGCLSVSSPVSRRVLTSLGVLTHLGVSSPVSACPHLCLSVSSPVSKSPHLCLGVSSPVSACPHPSQRVLARVSACPHLSRRVLTCLGVSSPVSRRVLACFSACPHRLGVLTRLVVSSPVSGVFLPVLACPHLCLGVSSPVSACPHPSRRPLLLLSSAGTPSTCPQRRQGVARGSTNRQMCSQ